MFTDAERATINIDNNIIYQHKVFRLNYTTYDLRRCQDSINPWTKADIMMVSQEDRNEPNWQPYWFARVIGIFHTFITMRGVKKAPERIDFLWVRWFGRTTEQRGGWRARHLHGLSFHNSNDPGAFGFLDPALVVRGIHLIPAFRYGQTGDLLPPSVVREPSEKHLDWCMYYVNMFVYLLPTFRLLKLHLGL
jgi:hypothetical protein